MTSLQQILAAYRTTSQTEREKGSYFEELIRTYFRHEPSYANLYSEVWLYADWAREVGTPQFGHSGKDTGIDLVAKTRGTDEFHAIQCKCYAEDHRVQKKDIDSFFTASGQAPFTHRGIVTTTNDWSENAENSLVGQTPPVTRIDLHDLENSRIDWAKYQPSQSPALKKKNDMRKHQASAKTNVLLGFKTADRGKLIMACGTGKTFTSLKIAEDVAGPGKITLFLVPSLNLLSQTLTEWTQQSDVPLHSFAVCSDAEVGKKRKKDDDIVETFAHELRYPATTDARRLAEEVRNNQLKVDDAARIIGCWKALSKQGVAGDLAFDAQPMRRAVAFCQVIERQKGAKNHKVSSKEITAMFQAVVEAYQAEEESDNALFCEAAHVDGSMNAAEKEAKLNWLKADLPDDTCRILSNVRCLSEGVDVPALDAVLFLTPRNSPVDVVQSVGRVMRTAPGKKLGYVILPVVIPSGVEPHEALNDNKVYKVVWDVLQALRSHDDRFDAFINKLDLIGSDPRKMEVIAITDAIQKKSAKPAKGEKGGKSNATNTKAGKGEFSIGNADTPAVKETQSQLQFQVGELERALYARVVKKCGNRNHWEDWANDIAKIAQTHISRITAIVSDPKNTTEVAAFQSFAHELRDDLNDSITDAEVIEMLAQHLITKPVFDALFADYSFASHNPVSVAMQHVLDVLNDHHLDKEADTLEKFYNSVRRRAADIDNAEAKQKIVVELYDKFFRNAFPRMTERLGIVYTPVEVVDFIIHSVNDLLQREFGLGLGSKGVHIIDPFTGTGTFITRLLQSGLIKPSELEYKYKNEIHANEIVLLAYYIAAINIEAVYHSLMKKNATGAFPKKSKIQNHQSSIDNPSPPYTPFEGICLTDTFQLYEKGDMISNLLTDNSDRRKRQKALDIRVIMGNPPYSVGQASENDNAANVEYPELDERIRITYAKKSSALLQKGLYDSYIRSIRWASDRIGKSGVIGFVTNAGFLDAKTTDGLRMCLAEEFSSIYVFHLRGLRGLKTSGERAKKEGGQIFGSGSGAAIAISLLVKNPSSSRNGAIHFHDIGEYRSREEKLQIIQQLRSVEGITSSNGWSTVIPDGHGDWLKQRDDTFSAFIVVGDKKGHFTKIFDNFSLGVVTNRDTWCYNASKTALTANMSRMIEFYNGEVIRFNNAYPGLPTKARTEKVDNFIDADPVKISWTRSLKAELAKDRQFHFEENCLTRSLYRPFLKQWLYFNRRFNEMVYQMPRFFPDAPAENIVIGVSESESRSAFSVIISDCVVILHATDMVGSQYFPLYLYEKADESASDPDDLFANSTAVTTGYTRRDAITDAGLVHFQSAYPAAGEGSSITKEDLFYYIYGLLHSPDYRSRYADNLGKELPRIPAVKTYAHFRAYEKAGRELAHWHLNYETVECFAGAVVEEAPAADSATGDRRYRVTKMKFAKRKDADTGKSVADKTTVHYNEFITIKNIPLGAYDYIVNGKPALEWVMERQSVTTDKASGITNDANLWATETMGNAKYPLELFLRVVTVSLETNRIVAGLPKLEID